MKRITDIEFNARSSRGQKGYSQYLDWVRSLELEKGPVLLSIDELPEKLRKQPAKQYHSCLVGAVRILHGIDRSLALRMFPDGMIGIALRTKRPTP